MQDAAPASAWLGRELARSDDWIHRFSAAELAELESAYQRATERETVAIDTLTARDFPLPGLGPVLRRLGEQIEAGLGFAFLRGLPVAQWGPAKSRVVYWGIACHLGVPISQNARGDKLVPVTDVGVSPDSRTFRGNRGRGDLNFHSDFADVVGLLCIRGAKSGGISRIASSASILRRMQRERPELIDALRRGFHFFRKGEEAPGEGPVSARRLPMLAPRAAGGHDFLFWPHFAKLGAEAAGVPLAADEQAAFDYINRVAREPGVFLDAQFQPGDMQFLNNYQVLHSRTDYEDWPEPDRKRYLERIWLRTRDARDQPPGMADLYGPQSLSRGIPVLPEALIEERSRGAGIAV